MHNPFENTYLYQKDYKVFVACYQCIRHDVCLLKETYGEPRLYTGEYNG